MFSDDIQFFEGKFAHRIFWVRSIYKTLSEYFLCYADDAQLYLSMAPDETQ